MKTYKITLKSGKEITVKFALEATSPIDNLISAMKTAQDVQRCSLSVDKNGEVVLVIVISEIAAIEKVS